MSVLMVPDPKVTEQPPICVVWASHLTPLCLGQTCCQRVLQQQVLTAEQMSYVGRAALGDYIPPSHCHLQNSGVQKFLPIPNVFELFHCWVRTVSSTHWPGYFVPSLKETYKILVYLYWWVLDIEGRNGRPPAQLDKKGNIIFLLLNLISITILIPQREGKGQIRDVPPLSLWWHLIIRLFKLLATRLWNGHCVWATIYTCWLPPGYRHVSQGGHCWVVPCSLMCDSSLIPMTLLRQENDSAVIGRMRLSEAFCLSWASFRNEGIILPCHCCWGLRENWGPSE